MNQIKIGAFISDCRKAKGWTQNQLGEKLGITDKAVSKWETGRSMPDLSLFMPVKKNMPVSMVMLRGTESNPPTGGSDSGFTMSFES